MFCSILYFLGCQGGFMGGDIGATTNAHAVYDYIPILLVSHILIPYIIIRFMKPRRSSLRHPLRPFWAKLRRPGYIIGASHKTVRSFWHLCPHGWTRQKIQEF